MSKRGQLYIFAALILCVVLFLLIGKRLIVSQEPIDDDFEELSKNYNFESAKFINGLLTLPGEKNVEEEFLKFTTAFTSYSKNQNPDFMLIYAFKYSDESGEKIYLGNYLNFPIFAKKEGGAYQSIEGCFDKISACVSVDFFKACPGQDMSKIYDCRTSFDGKYPIHIIVSGVHYKLDVGSDSSEIIIISRESLGEQRKVYMDYDFVSGNKVANDVYSLSTTIGDTNIDLCRILYNANRVGCEKDKDCCWNLNDEECKSGVGAVCS